MKKIFMMAFFILLNTSYVFAVSEGNDLLRECKIYIKWSNGNDLSKVESYEIGICKGVMEGVLVSNNLLKYWVKTNNIETRYYYCIPEGISTSQLAKVVVKYLDEHPEKLHEHRGTLLAYTFMKYFPCE
jgi:hypothetical protein